jgi:hypothetical protein
MYRWFALLLCLVLILASCSKAKIADEVKPAAATPAATIPSDPDSSPTSYGTQELPKSTELIDADLESGEIDETTALVYKTFAQFQDARLPAKYLGSADLNTDSHIIDQIQAAFPNLPPEIQEVLIPYLMPPIYKGAWGPPAEGGSGKVNTIELPCNEIQIDVWDSTSAMHAPVRFWWLKSRPGDSAIANRYMAAIDNDIWPKLTGVMGRTPLPDGNIKCNGGNADMDIYITPQIVRSYSAAHFPPGCKETPSYIVMNPAVSEAILAHEFMHAIQWSIKTSAACMYPGEYAWLAEATASWAQNYVYPDSNEEHNYVSWFYQSGGKAPPALDLRNDSHEYGAHLFFFFLTKHFGDPGIVKTVWDNTTAMLSVDAVDQAIPGGLDSIWGEFAVKNMVEPPYDEYQVWDQLNQKPSGSSLIKGLADANETYIVIDKINRLSIQYTWFTFGSDARLVTFLNGLTYHLDEEPINTYMGNLPIADGTRQYKFTAAADESIKGVKIQAYFKVQGDIEWQLEDWTGKQHVTFCRDAQAERLTDLVIITSNSSQDQTVSAAGTHETFLQVADIGCWRYGGTASLNLSGFGENGSIVDDQILPNIAFERTDAHPNIPYPILRFKVAEGQWNRSYTVQSEDGCYGSATLENSLGGASPFSIGNELYILYGAVEGSSARRYSGQANADQPITVHVACPDNSGDTLIVSQPWMYIDVLSQFLEKKYLAPKGGVLNGTGDLLHEASNAIMKFDWHFEPLAELGGGGSSQSSLGSSSSSSGSSSSSSSGSGGGSPQSPAEAGFPDVPDYPNGDYMSLQTGSGMLLMTTPDSLDEVVTFYRRELVAQGWLDVSSPSTSSGEVVMLMFVKDQKMITIMINTVEGKRQVMINQVGN